MFERSLFANAHRRLATVLLLFVACILVNTPAVAAGAGDFGDDVIDGSAMRRTRTVIPVFPRQARENGVEGWVELLITVTPVGEVADAQVVHASPIGVFEEAALTAVKQWQYEPVEKDGKPVSQRVFLKLRFAKS